MVQTHSCGLSAARRFDAAVSGAAETEVADGGAGESGRYSNASNGVKDATNVPAECGGILRTNTFVSCPQGRRVEEMSHRKSHVAAVLTGGDALRGGNCKGGDGKKGDEAGEHVWQSGGFSES